jgi:hypothetical protein
VERHLNETVTMQQQKSSSTVVGILVVVGALALIGCGVLTVVGQAGRKAQATAQPSAANAERSAPSAEPAATRSAADPLTSDGTWLVPSEVAPGTWRATVPASERAGCYYVRLKEPSDELDAIIDNDRVSAGGTATVIIKATDGAFKTSRCGTWTKIR